MLPESFWPEAAVTTEALVIRSLSSYHSRFPSNGDEVLNEHSIESIEEPPATRDTNEGHYPDTALTKLSDSAEVTADV
ncbi:hypothetical protein CANARDRAFT_9667 [[Candida] arabinofermentans NRRL YB-2248]|uniref:Uncharacterized protein n=1 Tax=[Candida] arabinofermentans NRRL YB-2248 TaxID=983967 RepID=A0A1E4SVA5_9ASCO|nr:hypothetical protein CANARDRAFT_9667 [[Candida] arabinofermentans NRRL YB-2248]